MHVQSIDTVECDTYSLRNAILYFVNGHTSRQIWLLPLNSPKNYGYTVCLVMGHYTLPLHTESLVQSNLFSDVVFLHFNQIIIGASEASPYLVLQRCYFVCMSWTGTIICFWDSWSFTNFYVNCCAWAQLASYTQRRHSTDWDSWRYRDTETLEATGTPAAGQSSSDGDLLSLRSHRHACRRLQQFTS